MLVLFVRDPRDALYSAWRRAQKLQPAIAAFAAWLMQIDPTWGVPRGAAYLLHLATWKHYAELHSTPCLVIRFEDVKANARAEFRRLQNFLPGSLDALTENQIARALSRSTFAAVKSVEDQMLADGRFALRINSAGVAYEYRSHFDASMHEAIGGRGRAIYRWLRYDEPPRNVANSVALKPCPIWIHGLHPERVHVANRALNDAISMYACE